MHRNFLNFRLVVGLIVFFGGLSILPGLPRENGLNLAGLLIKTLLPEAMAASALEITRVELYFENHRAEISKEQNAPGLKAFALIRLKGSGLLQGYWKVDNQIIGQISQHVTGDQVIIVQTPDIPALPTSNPGTHLVQFEISHPALSIPLPTALYFVTPSEHKGSTLGITQASPPNNSIHKYKPLTFVWDPLNDTTVYLIEFYDREKGASPIFSAYTRKPAYKLDALCLSKICEPGKTYYWKVKGFDSHKISIGESALWRFSFKK